MAEALLIGLVGAVGRQPEGSEQVLPLKIYQSQ